MSSLSIQDHKILAVLDLHGGFLTRRVALAVGGVGRRESAWVRQRLLRLKALGLVTELDDQKPVCWKLTPAGASARPAMEE